MQQGASATNQLKATEQYFPLGAVYYAIQGDQDLEYVDEILAVHRSFKRAFKQCKALN